MTRLAFYHCHNPNHARYGELVHVAGARWPIEECFGSAKNEVGLDDYQVRTWDAWHRHITLAILAHTAREDHRQEKSRRGPGAGAVAGVAISSWGWRRLGGYVGVW
jgi:SRSO17 transposase